MMSRTPTSTVRAELTAYEKEQVRRIAAWKSEPPNPFGEMFRMITLPGARAVERVLPDELVKVSIEKGYDIARVLAGREDIKHRAGVRSLGAMRELPLEDCDRLANRVGTGSQAVSVIEGAATGAAGPLTTLLDIPLLLGLSLRTILKIGHCYGYPLDRPKDRRYVLGVLVAALSGSLPTRRERLDRLRKIEDWLIQETEEEVIAGEVASLLFQLEIFEEIPGVGAVSGAVLNLAFIRRVEVTARRVFQERWLRDNGKVEEIAPADVHARALATGWTGALKRGAYTGCYYVGFGLAFPACYAASRLRPVDSSHLRGVHDGAAAAERGVDRWLGRARARVKPLNSLQTLSSAHASA